VLVPTAGGAQPYRVYGGEQFFTLDWEPGQYCGRATVEGHVANVYGIAADRVRLLVESLDASGQVTATTIGYVNGLVMPGTRVYFDVPVGQQAPSYRVSILSWDWRYAPSGA
jgi:hypothetical protein